MFPIRNLRSDVVEAKKLPPMGGVPIIGEKSRQQKREEGRKAAMNMGQLITELDQAFSWIHFRIDVAFESMRLMGATDEIFSQAEENVKTRRKILANQAVTVPPLPPELRKQ